MIKIGDNLRIGNLDLKNQVFLAPMAGVTDLPFRLICKQKGCALVYTEMVSAKGIYYNNENTNQMLKIDNSERPIAVQLFGSDPSILANIAKKLQMYDIIDINMGCPAPKIVKNGEGSALMKEPKKIGEIVKAVVNATDKPVTVKIRKGFDTNNALEVAKLIEDSGASAITIHGRTREQYYSGIADWDIIKQIKQNLSIPVIGNGDIDTPYKAKQMLEQTGCDAIMVGRAAQGNPWIFEQILHYLNTNEILPNPTAKQKIETALYHAQMLVDLKGEYIGIREMRKHISWYIKGIAGAAELRCKINSACNIEQMKALLENIAYL